jgi:hypothetical protein
VSSVNLMKINTITSLLMTSFIIFIILDIPRQTDEEKEFGDFQLFDDPNRPYSTFNFKYSPLAFDRMTQLMEYNTLRFKNLIMEKIRENVRKYQNSALHSYHYHSITFLSLSQHYIPIIITALHSYHYHSITFLSLSQHYIPIVIMIGM